MISLISKPFFVQRYTRKVTSPCLQEHSQHAKLSRLALHYPKLPIPIVAPTLPVLYTR